MNIFLDTRNSCRPNKKNSQRPPHRFLLFCRRRPSPWAAVGWGGCWREGWLPWRHRNNPTADGLVFISGPTRHPPQRVRYGAYVFSYSGTFTDVNRVWFWKKKICGLDSPGQRSNFVSRLLYGVLKETTSRNCEPFVC